MFTKCTVQKLDNEKSELTLLFEVVDTGTGFDAADESIMFKPFSQVDSSVSFLFISHLHLFRLIYFLFDTEYS